MAQLSHPSENDFGVLLGTDGADTITGGLGPDSFIGQGGDDTFFGKQGNDHILGGEGNDTVVFGFASTEVTGFKKRYEYIDSSEVFVGAFIESGTGTDQVDHVENYQFTDKTITLGELEAEFGHLTKDNFINDEIVLSPTNSTVDGGDGFDIVWLSLETNKLLAFREDNESFTLITLGSVSQGTNPSNYQLSNIEAVKFSDKVYTIDQIKANYSNLTLASETIIGTAEDDVVDGTNGDDSLYSATGIDAIDGKEGQDTLNFLFNVDQVSEYERIDNTVIIKSLANGLDDINTIENVEQFSFLDQTVSFEDLDMILGSYVVADQTITGTSENDRLSAGGYGSDVIDGLDGYDTAIFGISSEDMTHYEYNYKQENGVVTITHMGTEVDRYKNVEAFEFKDKTVSLADMDAVFNSINLKPQTFNATSGDDEFTGGAGVDTVILDIATTDVTTFTQTTQLSPDFSSGAPGFRVIYTTSINSQHGYDLFNDIDSFQFSDETLSADALQSTFSSVDTSNPHEGTADDDTLVGGHASDIFATSGGNDFIDGKAGLNYLFFVDIFKQDVTAYRNESGEITITIKGTKTDKVVNVEFFRFADNEYADLLTISDLDAEFGHLPIPAQSQDNTDTMPDEEEGSEGESSSNNLVAKFGEMVSGGEDEDGVTVDFNASEINQIIRKLDNTVEISTDKGSVFLENIENITFLNNAQQPLNDLILEKNAGKPVFNAVVNNEPVGVTPEIYAGPVEFLDYQLYGNEVSNVVFGSSFNDFLNLLGGDDAVNGGEGQDVLDGGTGSNFLIGGSGSDTFYLDGRGSEITWSTIQDFNGDEVNIWGWQEGVSQLYSTVERDGAAGAEGATFHYDLDSDGNIDTSITFSGLTLESAPIQSFHSVAGLGYILFE